MATFVRLLIHGARAAVHRVRIHQVTNTGITEMLGRRPFNVVTVALAHKIARIAWAIVAKVKSTARTYNWNAVPFARVKAE